MKTVAHAIGSFGKRGNETQGTLNVIPMNLLQRVQPDAGIDEELVVILAVVGGIFAVFLAVQIFFLMTLAKCLRRIHPDNRRMEPWQVWLNLIPIFNWGWKFVTIMRIADSLDNEYYERGYRADGDFGKTVGTVYQILWLLSLIFSFFAVGSLIPYVLYWIKISGYGNALRAGESGTADDDENRPQRSRRRRLDDDEEFDDANDERRRD